MLFVAEDFLQVKVCTVLIGKEFFSMNCLLS